MDLYSLGVVVFELWNPMTTGMERAVLLRDLRERGVIPAELEASQPGVCRLIRWLLAASPADRPTARRVLTSDLLPPAVGDAELDDLLRSLPEAPARQQRALDALFRLAAHGAAGGRDLDLEPAGTPLPMDVRRRRVLPWLFWRVGFGGERGEGGGHCMAAAPNPSSQPPGRGRGGKGDANMHRHS